MNYYTHSCFMLIPGSEKVKDSNSTAETLVESNNINRSLLILGKFNKKSKAREI